MSSMPGKICYICGRSFGTTSLAIHQKQCLKKREEEQARLPKKLRTKLVNPDDLPKASASGGPGGDMNDNDAAFSSWKQSLSPCENCGRTFLPDRLVVHQRSCRPGTAARRPPSRSPGGGGSGGSGGSAASFGSSPGGTAASDSLSPTRSGGSGRAVPGAASRTRPSAASSSRPSPTASSSGSPAMEEEEIPIGGGADTSLYATAADESGANASEGERIACPDCGRKFNPDALARHARVCNKVFGGKKEVTVAKSTPTKAPASGDEPQNKTNWRQKHAEFIKSVRAARKVDAVLKSGGSIADLPPPERDAHPEYIPCPHCGRRFNETAAERHIPKCASIENKPAPPPTHNRYTKGSPKLALGSGVAATSLKSSPAVVSPPTRPGSRDSRVRASGVVVRPSSSSSSSASGGRTRTSVAGPTAADSYEGSYEAVPPRSTMRGAGERGASTKRLSMGGGGSGPSVPSGGPPPKFCGECGVKVLKSTQKFCGECGNPF